MTRQTFLVRIGVSLLTLGGILAATVPSFAIPSASVFPTGLFFSPQTLGTVSGPQTITVYNIGTTNITVTGGCLVFVATHA